jgi:hypothetical protein
MTKEYATFRTPSVSEPYGLPTFSRPDLDHGWAISEWPETPLGVLCKQGWVVISSAIQTNADRVFYHFILEREIPG